MVRLFNSVWFWNQYVKGKDNSAADALSRYPNISIWETLQIQVEQEINMFELVQVNSSQIPTPAVSTMVPNQNFIGVVKGYHADKIYSQIYKILSMKGSRRSVPLSWKHHVKYYKLQNGWLYYTTLVGKLNYKLLISPYNDLIWKVIANAHSTQVTGHFVYRDCLNHFRYQNEDGLMWQWILSHVYHLQ